MSREKQRPMPLSVRLLLSWLSPGAALHSFRVHVQVQSQLCWGLTYKVVQAAGCHWLPKLNPTFLPPWSSFLSPSVLPLSTFSVHRLQPPQLLWSALPAPSRLPVLYYAVSNLPRKRKHQMRQLQRQWLWCMQKHRHADVSCLRRLWGYQRLNVFRSIRCAAEQLLCTTNQTQSGGAPQLRKQGSLGKSPLHYPSIRPPALDKFAGASRSHMKCLLPTTSLTFLLHLSALRVHAMSASLAAQGVRFATAILSTWEVQASIA